MFLNPVTNPATGVGSRLEHFYNRVIRGAGFRTFAKGFYGLLAFLILLVIDLVAHSLKTIQGPTLDLIRGTLQSVSLYFWGRSLSPFYIRQRDLSRSISKPVSSIAPIHALRWYLIALTGFCLLIFLPGLFNLQLTTDTFVAKTPSTVVSITIINAVWIAGISVIFGSFFKMVTFWQRTREVTLRILLWSSTIVAFVLYSYLYSHLFIPQETIYRIIEVSLRSLIVFATLFLWFRVPWIPHISKAAKNTVLIYSSLCFLLSIAAFILFSTDLQDNILRNYASIMHSVLGGFLLGLAAYFGLIFFNALFTLSSTELVERRQAEVQSLAKLTRFSSDVLTSDLLLDIPKLVDQITTLAREATLSDCAWLDLKTSQLVNGTVTEETYRSFDNITPDAALRIANESNGFIDKKQPRSFADELLTSKKAIVVNNVDILEEGWKPNGDSEGMPDQISSLLAIPLMYKSEMRGALYVGKEKEYGFDDEDATVLTAFSDVASLALDTARLLADSIEKQKFDGELRAARSMQQSLLPTTVPDIPGFEVSAISIPAYEVGGDYYDFLSLQDGSPVVITGDVSGKGISASIFMAETKGIVQALAPMMSSVGDLLVGTNDSLMRNLPKGSTARSFVTLAALSFHGQHVKYCRAGHTPLLHFLANGEFQYLQPKGMGIGFVKKNIFDSVLEEQEFILAKGEVLILFSDGITEVRNDEGEELGYQRFAEIVRSARFESDAKKIVDRILRDLLLYASSASFGDDATFVIVRRQ